MSDIIDIDTDLYYKPKNKKERDARRRVWQRFQEMRDDPLRLEAEDEWELGDKSFRQWMPERQQGDWRSHIALPDGFAGVQAHMQETIDRKSRPILESVESSDLAIENFVNSIMQYSMDRTGFDLQEYYAKQAAAIRGTSFVMERYRYEKRDIQDLTGVDADGNLTYTKKEIVDVDDTFTEFVENEFIFLDPGASHIDKCRDFIEREVMDWHEFQRVYKKKADFMNIKMVPKCGAVYEHAAYFKKPKDVSDDDVELLHYYNRATDEYLVLANNVLIRLGPLPFKHKELPIAVHTHYNIPGRIWGMGIPKVIWSLTEERSSLRNLAIDRQNMQINKMFLVNDIIDLDDEDFRTRPNGFIPINANGMRLDDAVKPIEFGDIPASYYKAEDMLLEDIRRAHGIDERSQAVESGGTATSAAITQQASQRRIALINTLAEMDTLVRIGRLKWSNIQFFYPAPRVERITEDNSMREKKIYRRIKVKGQEFKVVSDNGKLKLTTAEIDGDSGFKLDKTHARFMEGDFDVIVHAEPDAYMSKPLRQAKMTEMFNLLLLNPQASASIDMNKAVKRYLQINDENPKEWVKGGGMTDQDWQRLAIHENQVMTTGQPLAPTTDAPEMHTVEHLNFMNTKDYDDLINENPAIQMIFEEHVFGEHQNNPATGNMADAMKAAMTGAGGGDGGLSPPMPQGGTPPERQMADIEPGTAGGTDRVDAQQEALQE